MHNRIIKLSIIIPVYNVEKYIRRCIESCLNQNVSHNEYEILVIDDGTQDGSMNIVQQYVGHKTNIRIIEQMNAGLSSARNTGIREARGEYLWFVDSDDFIEDNVLDCLICECYTNQLDVLCFGLQLSYQDNSKSICVINDDTESEVVSGDVFISHIGMPPAAWCAIYRRNYLMDHQLFFIEGIIHEDQEFTPRAYYLAQRIKYYPVIVYNYFQREGSIMTSPEKRAKKAKDLLVVCDSIYQFARENIEEGSAAYKTMISKINFAFSQSLRNYTKGVSIIAEYKKRPYYPLDISVEGERRNRWKYRFINFSIPLYLLAHRLLKR